MNETITIRVERKVYANGTSGTLTIENRLDPILIEDAVDPAGYVLALIKFMKTDLDIRAKEIVAADRARE